MHVEEVSLKDRTFKNHCFIFKSDSDTMELIRTFLIKSGAVLIYQKHTGAKIFIKEDDGSESPARGNTD